MKRTMLLLLALLVGIACSTRPKPDPRLAGAFRNAPNNGWVFVHLQGPPATIGYQHGYLMAKEIGELKQVFTLDNEHGEHKDWSFYRQQAQTVMWPHVDQEYKDEMQGIADGATAAGTAVDVWDIAAMNAQMEWSYFDEAYNKAHGITTPTAPAPDHCSGFIATGAYTKDGKIVMSHNDWTGYLDGERWNVIFDITPSRGQRILMDGMPGLIHSGDDFGVNAAGIMITETTISDFHGYDFNGVPEYERARKAMQYATSIDEFASIMKTGDNGGYANDWLVGDRKTNEIASLELGLKNVTLERSKDGFFVSSNFPISPKLIREETTYKIDPGSSEDARHTRWLQLMRENKGKIDVAAAQRFEADHYDVILKKDQPSERTLCGHVDLSPRGVGGWQPPYGAAGAVQNKAISSDMAAQMSFTAASGHACGMSFDAQAYLAAHPDEDWQKSLLRDMPAHAWTTFQIANAAPGMLAHGQ